MRNYWVFGKLLSILCHQKKLFFSCVYIKCFKLAKKDIKNEKLKLFTKKDTFGYTKKFLEVESDVANWAQIFDKCDPENKNTDKN